MAIAHFCDHCGAENAHGETLCHACQHPLTPPSTFEETGKLLNERYAILSEVGAGGFGAVYLARDTHISNQLVAVKQINLKGLSSQEIIEATDAFNREAEILTTLSHSLLPTIFDRFSDPEHWYLVMTYIDGSTLDEYLQQQKVKSLPHSSGLPLGETLEIALQLCDALHYLHSQQPPVIFRDLKPGNIMRTRKGRLYLIDFGIARRFKPGQLKDTIPFGSPGFAAPEQYGRAQTTPQADIYSLGALLFCLITGDDPSEHPFDFSNLHHYDIAGTRELDTLIHRMVALDPPWRPANIKEVQTELQHIQQLNIKANQQGRLWTPPQGQTPPPPGSKQQQRFVFNPPISPQLPQGKTTRRRVLTTTLVLGGVAAFGGMIALANQSQQISPVDTNNDWYQQTADAQNAAATETASSATPAVPLNGSTFWSPDMSYAAVANQSQQQVEIYKVQGQQLIRIIKTVVNSANFTAWWSPDNGVILTQTDSNIIYAWNVGNGQQIFNFSTLPDTSLATIVSWSPDGQNCAISHSGGGNMIFTILRASDGQTLFQKSWPNPANATANNVAWSPDSHYFAFPDAAGWPGGQSWSIGIWDRGTYQRINSFSAAAPSDSTISSSYSIGSVAWSSSGQKLATIIYDTIYIAQLGNNLSTSVFQNVTLALNVQINNFIWSPNERYLATLVQQDLAVWDASSGQQMSLNGTSYPPQNPNIVAFSWTPDSQGVLVADQMNNLFQWTIVQP